MKYIKLFENFMDQHKSEYKAVQNGKGQWEIHIKNPVDTDFNLPTSGTLWTNDGKYYSSEGDANAVIKSQIEGMEDDDFGFDGDQDDDFNMEDDDLGFDDDDDFNLQKIRNIE